MFLLQKITSETLQFKRLDTLTSITNYPDQVMDMFLSHGAMHSMGGELEGGGAAVVRLVGACGEEGIRDLAVPVHRRVLHPNHHENS